MKGADEFCRIFTNAEQVENLYILPSSHERGATFQLYVLPHDEKVIENGGINPPLNKDSVEVYGIISGQPGWTEEYGWLHSGKWQEDFNNLWRARVKALQEQNKTTKETRRAKEIAEDTRISRLLSKY